MAPSVIVAVALWVWIVKIIVWLSYIHCESAETPLGRIGCERKLEVSREKRTIQHLKWGKVNMRDSPCPLQSEPREKDFSSDETKKGKELTGDAEREGGTEVRPALGRRLVDEVDISGL